MSTTDRTANMVVLLGETHSESNPSIANWTKEFEDLTDTMNALKINLNHFYLCSFSIITIAIPMGLALMDVGLVRTKSAGDLLLRTSMDFLIGTIAFWMFGYALAWGDGTSFIGWTNFAYAFLDPERYSHAFFHLIYACVASMIVSGSVSERLSIHGYFIYSVTLSGFAYPLLSRWGWHEIGWLKALGYHDFAGSGAVFLFGGSCALVACKFLGPRLGRFNKHNNDAEPIQGHSLPLFGLGFMLVAFGFLGYNAGSQLNINRAGDGPTISYASLNTLLACSAGALTCLVIQRFFPTWGHYWSYVTMCNGATCAMVASCAGCYALPTWGAYVTGICAGIAFLITRHLMIKLRIDDPTEGIAINFAGGLTGLISCPLLIKDGVLMKQDHHSAVVLGINALGAFITILWAFLWTVPIFAVLRYKGILRVPREVESAGIDLIQQDEQAYPPSAWSERNGSILSTGQTVPASPNSSASHANPVVSTDQQIPSSPPAVEASVQAVPAGRRRKPAPRLQNASLSSTNLISESVEIALEEMNARS